MTPKPEAQVARFLVGMFRNRFFEAGVDAKVSPKVLLDQAIDEKVSPKVSLDQAIDEKVSPNKEAVFFYRYFFLWKWNTHKVSPNWDGSKSVTE